MMHIDLIKNYYDAYARGDIQQLPIADEIRHTSPMAVVVGKDAYIQECMKFAGMTQRVDIIDWAESEEKIAVRAESVTMYGIFPMSEWFYISNGTITEIISYFNAAGSA